MCILISQRQLPNFSILNYKNKFSNWRKRGRLWFSRTRTQNERTFSFRNFLAKTSYKFLLIQYLGSDHIHVALIIVLLCLFYEAVAVFQKFPARCIVLFQLKYVCSVFINSFKKKRHFLPILFPASSYFPNLFIDQYPWFEWPSRSLQKEIKTLFKELAS